MRSVQVDKNEVRGGETHPAPGRAAPDSLRTLAQRATAIGFFETLVEGLRLPAKVYVYSHRNKIETIAASVGVGCRHIVDIQRRLVPDTQAAGLFGMARFPDQSQINTFLRAFGPAQVGHLERQHEQLLVRHSRVGDRARWLALPDGRQVVPIDVFRAQLATRAAGSTSSSSRAQSRPRFWKSVAVLGAGVREALWVRLEPDASRGHLALPIVIDKATAVTSARDIAPGEILVRGDERYVVIDVLRKLQAAGHHYIIGGASRTAGRRLAETLPSNAVWTYRGVDGSGAHCWCVDAGVRTWRGQNDPADLPPLRSRAIVLVRVQRQTRLKRGRGAPDRITQFALSHDYYVTDLAADVLPAPSVLDVHNSRETEEAFFGIGQDDVGAGYLRTRHEAGEAAFLWLLVSTLNLLRWT